MEGVLEDTMVEDTGVMSESLRLLSPFLYHHYTNWLGMLFPFPVLAGNGSLSLHILG